MALSDTVTGRERPIRTAERPRWPAMPAAREPSRRLREHAGLTQVLEALGEHGARYPEVRGEVAEATHAEERVAHDQQRPTLTDDLESARERAPLSRVILGQSHSPMLPVRVH